MNEDKEIKKLQEEIAVLEREKEKLKTIKSLKIQKLKTKLFTIPSKLGAKHPLVASTLHLAKEAGLELGAVGYEGGKALFDYANRTEHHEHHKRYKKLAKA